jgi:hypothetical protein
MRTRITRAVGSIVLALGLAAVFAPVAAGASTRAVATSSPVLKVVTGAFDGSPLAITNVVPTGITPTSYSFDATGGDSWTGDLQGTTKYQGHGTTDIATHITDIQLVELFTGTVKGFGTGSLLFIEALHQDPHNLGSVDAFVLYGSGDLSGMHGYVHFQASQILNPDSSGNGEGLGTYYGLFVK